MKLPEPSAPVRPDRKVMGLNDFIEADVQAISGVEPPSEAAAFDDENSA